MTAPACGTCDGSGKVDSGGQDPAGNWIDRDCPECRPSTQPASTGAALLATILLVSNEDYIRELIGAILSVEGYKVLQADGAQSALDQAEFGSKIDLILVDAYLPGMPMLELVNRIRAFNQQAALLCMSGGGTLDASRDLDPSECIQKPFTPRRMVERIAAALKAATGGD